MSQQPRNPVLGRLQVLVGEWTLVASIGGKPTATGKTRFEWLEGGGFLIQHAEADPLPPDTPPEWLANNPFPLTTIFGLDDAKGTFSMLYSDARGVCRVYEMSLEDGAWKDLGPVGSGLLPALLRHLQPRRQHHHGPLGDVP